MLQLYQRLVLSMSLWQLHAQHDNDNHRYTHNLDKHIRRYGKPAYQFQMELDQCTGWSQE
jgi:hypothetical protein